MCPGTAKAWVKTNKKTVCPKCQKPISKLGGHPQQPVPVHN